MKVSHGFIIFDKNFKNVVVLIKRISYEFSDIINENYSSYDEFKYLVSRLTKIEKIILKTNNFNNLWQHYINRSTWSENGVQYTKKLKKFNMKTTIFIDKYFNQPNVVTKQNDTSLYDFPKGRPVDGETEFDTAIRETYEETGLTINDYHIHYDLGTFIDLRKTTNEDYIIIYRVATLKHDLNDIHKKFKKNYEIKDIKIFNVKSLISILQNESNMLLNPIVKILKKRSEII
jgi:8-oxo-dGTP pyrophosphatase MutT (NUDIX family)